MKTFKLVSLQIVEENGLKDIELVDGLIINKEDEHNTWLIEAFTDLRYHDYFKKAVDEDREMTIQVIITKKDNDPAPFETKICTLKKLENHLDVLFEGTLKRTRTDYAEQLLEHLLSDGLEGDELLAAFKERIVGRPTIPRAKK